MAELADPKSEDIVARCGDNVEILNASTIAGRLLAHALGKRGFYQVIRECLTTTHSTVEFYTNVISPEERARLQNATWYEYATSARMSTGAIALALVRRGPKDKRDRLIFHPSEREAVLQQGDSVMYLANDRLDSLLK